MNNKFHKVIRFHKGWKRSILIILILLISSVGTYPASGQAANLQAKTDLSAAAPVITGQNSLSTLEDTPLKIGLENLIVSDPANAYPTGFTLTVLSGTNYTFVDTTITPALNFVGTLTVPVNVNNGTVESNVFDLTVGVTPANGVPVADSRIPPGERPHGNNGGQIVRPNATSTIANPTLVTPSNGATEVASSPTLTVHVSNTAGSNMTVSFYGRATNSAGAPFTLVALPDTQCYSGGEYNYEWCGAGGIPEMFYSQTQWIVNNRTAQNIVFVTHLGDVTNDGDNDSSEWDVADTAMSYLEDPTTTGLPWGVPYGIMPGNHDQTLDVGTTVLYNRYFGSARFSGRGYYGGHYGSNNNNNYELFSAGGMDFIIVHLEYNPTNGAITWADNLLKTYSNRRAIVSSHAILYPGNPADFDSAGTNIYNGLKDNPNLFLMLCGHEEITGQRTDTYLGNTIYSLMSDYQWGDNGGDGWLRLMKFVPSLNQIQVSTYSPYEDQYSTTSDDQFNLSYNMGFSLIGTANNVPSATNSSITWNGLTNNTHYDWYAVASDGTTSATSATWNFTTGAGQTLTVGKSGTGTGSVTINPSGINCGSTCSYAFANNTVVTLTASATSPSTFGGWSGAGCSGTGTCQVTMSAAQSVTATFTATSMPSSWYGSAVISANRNVVALARPQIGDQVMAYDGFTSGSKTVYLPMLFKNIWGYDSAFYIQNLDTTNPASITETFYDTDGNLSCTLTDSIPAQSSHGTWVPDLTCLPASWVGGLVVTSNRDIVGVGRPHIGTEITTYNGFASGSLTMYVPMLFKAIWGYDSAFYIQNLDPTNAANVTEKFYDTDGNLSCTMTDSIPRLSSHGTWVPDLTCLPDSWAGALVVTSDRNIVAVGRPHLGTAVTTYDGFAGGSTNFTVPSLFKDLSTYESALYVQNISPTTSANITMKFYDMTGNLTCTQTDSIPLLSSHGYWFPDLTCLGSSWEGSVKITSDQAVVAVGRLHNGSDVGSFDGFTAGNPLVYIPMLFNNMWDTYNSTLTIQNTDTSNPANLTINFYDVNGNYTCKRTDSLPALGQVDYWMPDLNCAP